ncbi:hypothetical protein D3C76_1745050 [compost metagenome]
MILQGDHQAHDRAFDQPGTLNQFHQAQRRIADSKSREHGQDPVSRSHTINRWTRPRIRHQKNLTC